MPDSAVPHAYITTPIYYVNDRPHIGHCYTTLLADVLARFERLRRGLPFEGGPSDASGGVFFLTGTDEHAEKVVTTAASHNLSPIAWADQNSAAFQQVFRELGFTFDDFIRTTQPRHKDKVTEYLSALLKTGDVAEGEYEGWYDVNAEAYVTETKAKEANFLGDNGKPLVRRREKNFYFKLSKYQKWLEESIASGSLRIEPEARRNEVLGRLREGLEDVPITRPVTNDPATQFGIRMPGHEDHRVYVWIDALFNYLSAVDTPERRHLWPPAVHLMGKEILWFHAVIWPSILKALGRPLPRLIYAHSHYTRDGKKMSKSLGNFIDLETIRAYTSKFGVDALRWYLVTQGPLHATDADFSHAKFVEVFNAELNDRVSNCINRVGNMIEKYFEGKVPNAAGKYVFTDAEMPFGAKATDSRGNPMSFKPLNWPVEISQRIAHALASGIVPQSQGWNIGFVFLEEGPQLVRSVDDFISSTQPFKLAKDPANLQRVASILYCCAEALRIASLLLAPALPSKMAQFWKNWNCAPPPGVPLETLCEFGGPYALKPGHSITKGDPLFMRADPAEPPPAPNPA
jgi:methionyl-tRNA synthetase